MKYTSIIEKLGLLIKVIAEDYFNLFFVGLIILCLFFLGFRKLSGKKCCSLILVGYFLFLAGIIYFNHKPLLNVFNSIMDHLFMDIYFPSVYVYLFVLIIVNIAYLTSFIKIHRNQLNHKIHTIAFFTMDFLFALILELIALGYPDKEIDVFSKTSLFANTDLVVLLELSVIVFIVWLLALGVVYVTSAITQRVVVFKANKEFAHEEAVAVVPTLEEAPQSLSESDTLSETVVPLSDEVVTGAGRFVPTMAMKSPKLDSEIEAFDNKVSREVDEATTRVNNNNYIESLLQQLNTQNSMSKINSSIDVASDKTDTFDLSSFVPPRQETQSFSKTHSNHILEQILQNQLPLASDTSLSNDSLSATSSLVDEKDTYTLNDYRIFNKMLKDIREHNHSNVISIDKNLEYRLITKYSTEVYDMFKKMLKNYSNS